MSLTTAKLGLIAGLTWPGVGRGEQWETLFEGTVETDTDGTYNGASGSIGNSDLFAFQETIRLTVDGVSTVFTVESSEYGVSVGNQWLMADFGETYPPDTGYDFCANTLSSIVSIATLYSRNPGTYQMKIERAVS